jgi:hypothetical protein
MRLIDHSTRTSVWSNILVRCSHVPEMAKRRLVLVTLIIHLFFFQFLSRNEIYTTRSDNKMSASDLGNHIKQDTIAWLSMGPAKEYQTLRDRFAAMEHVEFYYHSYDEPCDGCIFQNRTSFPEGRNLLLQTALTTNPHSKYFVFFDDDVQLLCEDSLKNKLLGGPPPPNRTENYCWHSFTKMLLHETYPFIKPIESNHDKVDVFTTRYQSCTDENFKAFHRDYLWFFFPSESYMANISWWITGRAKMYLSQRCFPHAWKVDGQWAARNDLHRPYPRGEGEGDLEKPFMDHSYPELQPWNSSYLKCCHRCEVSPTEPSIVNDMDPVCARVLQNKFYEWKKRWE